MLNDVKACNLPAVNPSLPMSPQAGWQISQQPTSPTQTRRRRKKKTREMTIQRLRIKMLATAAATPTTCCWDSLLWVCMDILTLCPDIILFTSDLGWLTYFHIQIHTFFTDWKELNLRSVLLFRKKPFVPQLILTCTIVNVLNLPWSYSHETS